MLQVLLTRFDRLLRYSADLDRELERTQSQLERVQAMRRGHTVLALIKLMFLLPNGSNWGRSGTLRPAP